MTWDIATGRRFGKVEHAWDCGWCADGRLLVRNEDGDCYFADAELSHLCPAPIPSRLTAMDDLSTDDTGTHLLIKYVRPIGEPIRHLKNWLKPGSGNSFNAKWECFDIGGRRLASVPGWTGGCCISSDGRYFAVGSWDGKTVDVYELPQPSPGGLVLALMIAELALFIAWTVWRRRFVWKLPITSTV
jgi:hypothetical protein